MNVKAKVLKVMDYYGFDHNLNIFCVSGHKKPVFIDIYPSQTVRLPLCTA